MRPHSSSRGVTLLEVLVVLLITIILAALIFPLVSQARQASNTAKCLSNLRQIGQAFRGYIDEHNGFAPPHWGEPFFESSGPSTLLWTGHLASYLGLNGDVVQEKLPAVFDCPQDPDSRSRPPGRGFTSTADNWRISYGYNYAYITSQNNWWRHASGYPSLRGVGNMTKLVLAADSMPFSKGGDYMALLDASSFVSYPRRGVDFRHRGMFNAVFLDGHVQGLDKETLSNPEYWQPMP